MLSIAFIKVLSSYHFFTKIQDNFSFPTPARKNRRTGAAFLPEPLLPRRPNHTSRGATAQSETGISSRIFSEKSSNFK
jgi:hypothetical protein